MKQEIYENFVFREGTTDEEKKYMIELLRHRAKEKERVCVIYTPDCGCNIEYFVVLDRYPMSPKIMSLCCGCKKGVLLEISDPIVFHCPWDETDLSLKDLLKMEIIEGSEQEHLLRQYQFIAQIQDLEEKLNEKDRLHRDT